jgi:hypothetical protein
MDPLTRGLAALGAVLDLLASCRNDLHQVDPERLYWLLHLIRAELERARPDAL